MEENEKKKQKGEVVMGERIPRKFTFDAVYGVESKNIDMFNGSFKGIADSIT